MRELLKSKKGLKILLLLFSVLIGFVLYLTIFMNILPMFFSNMENIEKNILAILIIIFTIYILIAIAFNLDTKIERYVILFLYLIVLLLGLLRPDQSNFGETGIYSWNPFGFIFDVQNDDLSLIIMFINILIFVPMYFLLAYANIFKNFLTRLIIFEIFIFLIEYLQALLKIGIFDLSDVFLYNIGFFIGYIISLPFLKVLKNRLNKNRGDV